MNKLIKRVTVLAIVTLALTLTATALDDWQQFQKNEIKIGISNATAIVGAGPTVTWSHIKGQFMSAPITHDGFVYASNGGGLYKYYYNGTHAWNVTTVGTGTGSPAYGEGTGRIFVYWSSGGLYGIAGVNDSDPSDKWQITTPAVCGGEVTYAVNSSGNKSVYFGDNNNFLCYDVGGTTNFIYRWNYTQGGDQFWAGASVIGDYVLFGNDSGWVTCLHESNGTYADSVFIGAGQTGPHIRSSISWNATNATYGHIFFTNCQGFSGGNGYAWKIGFNTNTGQFNDNDVTQSMAIDRATTTPVIHNGRVYTGGYSSFGSGSMYCFQESDLSLLWQNNGVGPVQSSAALTERDDTVYLYVTLNSAAGGIVCIKDTGSTGTIEWTDTTVGGYTMQGVAVAENETGTWLFATSQGAGRLAGHWASAPVNKPDLNVTAIDNSTIYSGAYNIIRATVINGGNGSSGQFDVTLSDNSAGLIDTETVSSLGAGESIEVKFLWTPSSTTNYILDVTADPSDIVDESDETNNSMTKSVSAIDLPTATDLVVIEVNNGDLFNNMENTVFAVIENRGANASAFNVSLMNGIVVVDTVFIPKLVFRDSQLVAFNWTPSSAGTANLNVSIENGGYKTQSVLVTNPSSVNVNSGSSIQSAINSASDNTRILVGSGVYNEQVTIPAGKSGIRLIANGPGVVICNNSAGDIITVKGSDCYVEGCTINSTLNTTYGYVNDPGAGVNITSDNNWNVIKDNYIYNTSVGIKLYGSDNLIRCNTVGDSTEGRSCLTLMTISGDCNAIVKNLFDGDTGNGWILGGTYTTTGFDTNADANNNTVRCNNFTLTGNTVDGVFWPCGNLVFGGDPNMVFNNIINDTEDDPDKIELGELNWYDVGKVAVEYPKCGNVVHGPYYGGNYWTAYTGSDNTLDLLGDTNLPHRVYDRNPLIRALCGDVTCDDIVNMGDVIGIRNYLYREVTLCNLWAADVTIPNCDDDIRIGDVIAVRNSIYREVPLNCCDCDC